MKSNKNWKNGLEKEFPDVILKELYESLDELKNNLVNNPQAFEKAYEKTLYELVKLGKSVGLKSETILYKYNSEKKEKFQNLFEYAYTRNIPLDEYHDSDLIELLKEIEND